MRSKRTLTISLLCLFCTVITCNMLLDGCKGKNNKSYTLTGDTVADGKNLAQLYCTKCHQLVLPGALTRDVWKFHTMPDMAPYVGITPYMDGYYKKDSTGVTLLEWQSILTYYQKLAPDTLAPAHPAIKPVEDWAGFILKTPEPAKAVVYTTLAAINPFTHKIYTSDQVAQNLVEWDSSLKIRQSEKMPSAAVSAAFVKNSDGTNTGLFSCIGQLEAADFPNGKIIGVNFDNGKPGVQTIIASDLPRPVQLATADFNKDGLTDNVVCGQGYTRGGVFLLSQKKDHTYDQTTITAMPGAVQAVAGDYNNDGWPDVMVLFSSGNDGIYLFLNDKKGGFTTKELLQFPPVNGSSSFQLIDMDHDGKPDLVYTSGFNYKNSRILKPYHGLYLFKNTGDWNFKQQMFYPIDGCTKAIAADFDGDGNIDIITSAFFADLKNNAAESCIYFKGGSKAFTFKALAIPVSKYGRWYNMDVGDYNNDGKPDVVLANYSTGFNFQRGLKPFWSKNIPFIILQNNFKK